MFTTPFLFRLEALSPGFVFQVEKDVLRHSSAFEMKHVVYILHAHASVAYASPAVLQALGGRVVEEAADLDQSQLASAAWSCARLGEGASRALEAVAQEVIPRAGNAGPSNHGLPVLFRRQGLRRFHYLRGKGFEDCPGV